MSSRGRTNDTLYSLPDTCDTGHQSDQELHQVKHRRKCDHPDAAYCAKSAGQWIDPTRAIGDTENSHGRGQIDARSNGYASRLSECRER